METMATIMVISMGLVSLSSVMCWVSLMVSPVWLGRPQGRVTAKRAVVSFW